MVTFFRFVAVSATIPNAEDIALWLGGEQGVSHKFGEERRPVQLRKVGGLVVDPSVVRSGRP